jgi:hypothetical protein
VSEFCYVPKVKRTLTAFFPPQNIEFMKEQNSQNGLVAQWRNSEIDNPAGPLFISGEFAEADIAADCGGPTNLCGTACSGSVTRQCC